MPPKSKYKHSCHKVRLLTEEHKNIFNAADHNGDISTTEHMSLVLQYKLQRCVNRLKCCHLILLENLSAQLSLQIDDYIQLCDWGEEQFHNSYCFAFYNYLAKRQKKILTKNTWILIVCSNLILKFNFKNQCWTFESTVQVELRLSRCGLVGSDQYEQSVIF